MNFIEIASSLRNDNWMDCHCEPAVGESQLGFKNQKTSWRRYRQQQIENIYKKIFFKFSLLLL